MGFTDLFKPKWKHSNPEVRADAVRALGDDEAALLATIVRSDADVRVRRIAVKRIVDAEVLTDVAAHDPDESLRQAAIEKAEEVLVAAANGGDGRALEALGKLKHPRLLAPGGAQGRRPPRCAAAPWPSSCAAATTSRSPTSLRKSTDVALRRSIVGQLHDATILRDVAIADGNKEVALAAVARLEDRAALDKVVHKAQSKAVRQAARDKLPAPEKKAESPEAQKRARLLELVRTVEQATEPAEVEAARSPVLTGGRGRGNAPPLRSDVRALLRQARGDGQKARGSQAEGRRAADSADAGADRRAGVAAAHRRRDANLRCRRRGGDEAARREGSGAAAP